MGKIMNKIKISLVILTVGVLSLLLVLGGATAKTMKQPLTSPDKSNLVTIIPEVIGQIDIPAYALGVWVAGDYAYVADGDNGLNIINISNPANPVKVGFYLASYLIQDVVVAGNYAYIAEGWYHGFRILDISTPANPTEVGFYETQGFVCAVAVSGRYAYVDDAYTGFFILDISNPAVPNVVGSYEMADPTADMAVAGDYAYFSSDGLMIIDISNPVAPKEVGFYDLHEITIDIAVEGNYAYLHNYYPWSGLHIIDISDPAAPTEVGFYDTLVYYGSVVVVQGRYAYITGLTTSHGLQILDISNPTAPVEVGFYDTPRPAKGGMVVGNHVYIAEYDAGLVILHSLTDNVTKSIPIEGGSLTSMDGNTNLTFSRDAFTETVSVTYKQLLYDENIGMQVGIGHTFDISAVYSDSQKVADLAPGETFTVTLKYTDTETGSAKENTLALYHWDGVAWVKETTSALDPVNNLITATPDHLSLWAVLGETNRVFLPLTGR
jgi:hypothetical protein